ncbi:MAG: iron-containing alcohol dehydrogenase [Niabella sp.]
MSSYQLSGKIIIGNLSALPGEIEKHNPKSVLVLSSPSVMKNPVVQEFIDKLTSQNSNVTIYGHISPDAPIAALDNLISGIEKPDLIIGIGGGSVMDSSKAISLGWQGASVAELFYKHKKAPLQKIPVFAVPTTAGTGAELSYGAILYDDVNKFKGGIRGPQLQPEVAYLDVALYKTASPKLIAEVGFDCLTHAIETYISTASNPLVQYQSVAAINTVFAHLPQAINKHEQSLSKVAVAATMMGINLALSSTCLPHRIQYVIGPATGTSHAQGLIMLYAGWLKEIALTDRYQMLASEFNLSTDALTQKIEQLKRNLDINYRLSDYGVAETDIRHIAEKVEGNLNNDPCYKSTQTIINILKNSL